MHRRVRRRDEENCRARETPCRGCGCGCSSYAVRMLHVQNDSLFHYRRAPLYCIGQRPNELLPSIRFSNCGYHKYRPTYGEFVRRNSSAASARNRKLSGSIARRKIEPMRNKTPPPCRDGRSSFFPHYLACKNHMNFLCFQFASPLGPKGTTMQRVGSNAFIIVVC